MKRVIFIVACLGLLLSLSCERRKLTYDYIDPTFAKLPISVDWVELGEAPQNVTVLFYDLVSGELVREHRYEHNKDAVQSYAEVREGKYRVVVFNELRNQIRNVGCAGYGNYETLEFYLRDNTTAFARGPGMIYVGEPDHLAYAVVEDVDVTEEVIKYTRALYEITKRKGMEKVSAEEKELMMSVEKQTKVNSEMLTGIVPELKTVTLSITMHVQRLHNARMPALVDLMNLASNRKVCSDDSDVEGKAMQFTIDNRTYDDDKKTDGTVSAEVLSFGGLGPAYTFGGQPEDRPLTLDVVFQLMDTARTLFVVEGVNLEEKVDEVKKKYYEVYLALDTALTDVIPELGADSSGFGTNVDDWGTVDVPLVGQ